MADLVKASLVSLVGAIVVTLNSLMLAYPLMLVWNAVTPSVFELKEIDFVQSFLLIILSWILFKVPSTKS